MSRYPSHPVSEAGANLAPPRFRPPTAVGLGKAEPPEPPGPPRRRDLDHGLINLLRRAEIAIFGIRRTIGPWPGPTPTF